MYAELVQKLSAIFTVPSDCRSFKALEEHVRQKGAEFLQAALRELLERLDKELAGQRPRGLTLKDLHHERWTRWLGRSPTGGGAIGTGQDVIGTFWMRR